MIKVLPNKLKTNLSSYFKKIKEGAKIALVFGKKNKTIAYLIPMEKYVGNKVKLGLGKELGYSYSSNDSFRESDWMELFDQKTGLANSSSTNPEKSKRTM